MTVVVLNVHWRQPEKYRVSSWIKRVILGKLAYIMCIHTDYNQRDHQKYGGTHGPPLRLSRHTQLSQDDPEFMRETSLLSAAGIPMQQMMNFYENTTAGTPPVNRLSRTNLVQRRAMFAATGTSTDAPPYSASLNEESLPNHVGGVARWGWIQ